MIDAASVNDGGLEPLWAELNAASKGKEWVYAEHKPMYPEGDYGVLSDVFWFGVYKVGNQFAYEIRPAYEGGNTDAWPNLEYIMQTNWDRWMVLAPTSIAAGTPSSDLWVIEGFTPANLARGVWYPNLALLSPAGRRLKRFKQFGRQYLGDWHGYGGKIALLITRFPVPPHRSPKP
ncbi:MAG: hypothetical protein WCC62_24250 [Pseudomonas capeferrum]|jgi:hypothetical protein|uniref:hypothetical protein n=1 Tax=Pseudomonas sp. 39004 TaxID=2967213 RepID=UPI0023648F89|nr:hypothetical protein [Pseudomonas sp. 39004]MDD1961671.1 hypothetical protein [Pseudomonas sp. 39004]